MNVLMIFLYILLFLVFLSILIVIHELGHLIAAKTFKVYCLEYSIGMGPAIFKYKRKGGETQFTLRGIPFGGYVSMYGEGVELPEGVVVDESRSLNGIKAWKRAIVLAAGVTMNALLALVFFAISNALPQLYYNVLTVKDNTPATVANMPVSDSTGIPFAYSKLSYKDEVTNKEEIFYLVDKETVIDGNETIKYAACFNFDSLNVNKRDASRYLFIYPISDENVDFANLVKPETVNYLDVHISPIVKDESGNAVAGEPYTIRVTQTDGVYDSFGCEIYYGNGYNSFGQVVKNTFLDFGDSSVLIFRTIGELFFKPATWNNVGGIVAVGFETTNVLQNYGFTYFLRIWGIISVNLAIFNLLPFPGLDGWQLLVLAVESIFRKKIPEKVKNIVSLVGIGLLLVLMVVILAKDLWTYVFEGLFK